MGNVTARADIEARVMPCPRCHADPGEPCAGTGDGSHTARVAAWQWAARAGHLDRPEHERTAVARIIADIRAGFARQGKACGTTTRVRDHIGSEALCPPPPLPSPAPSDLPAAEPSLHTDCES